MEDSAKSKPILDRKAANELFLFLYLRQLQILSTNDAETKMLEADVCDQKAVIAALPRASMRQALDELKSCNTDWVGMGLVRYQPALIAELEELYAAL
jgi:hypothetical protein